MICGLLLPSNCVDILQWEKDYKKSNEQKKINIIISVIFIPVLLILPQKDNHLFINVLPTFLSIFHHTYTSE